MCIKAVVKATLYSVKRPILSCILTFNTQPIKLQRFVKKRYAVIAHNAFHAYVTTYLLIFYANFQRFISNVWCAKSK